MKGTATEGSVAEWVQPKALDPRYELHAAGAVVGTLSFRSSLGTLAEAAVGESRWTFKRVGFLNPRITLRVLGQHDDIAVYQPKFWGDGLLRFADGRTLRWSPTNFWATEWMFSAQDGLWLARFHSGVEESRISDVLKTQLTVEWRKEEAWDEMLPVLLPLGLYLIVLHRQDVAAAAVVT